MIKSNSLVEVPSCYIKVMSLVSCCAIPSVFRMSVFWRRSWRLAHSVGRRSIWNRKVVASRPVRKNCLEGQSRHFMSTSFTILCPPVSLYYIHQSHHIMSTSLIILCPSAISTVYNQGVVVGCCSFYSHHNNWWLCAARTFYSAVQSFGWKRRISGMLRTDLLRFSVNK